MSGAAFTPGPWHPGHFVDDTIACDCHSILSECYVGAVAVMCIGNGLPISDGGNDAPPLEEAKANARLIAAAPELYEALQECLREHGGFLLAGECERQARAALAKARGEL